MRNVVVEDRAVRLHAREHLSKSGAATLRPARASRKRRDRKKIRTRDAAQFVEVFWMVRVWTNVGEIPLTLSQCGHGVIKVGLEFARRFLDADFFREKNEGLVFTGVVVSRNRQPAAHGGSK